MTNINDFTIMLPVHRGNIPFANECIQHLLDNSLYRIIVVDDLGKDEDYVNDARVSFIHNKSTERIPLVKIWNQCIKECPTNNVIIASWRQRPILRHFEVIKEKLENGYGMVTFDGLHFFGLNKYLTTCIGFFDEGFTKGQYEDTDWFNRLKTGNIAIFVGQMLEQRQFGSTSIGSMWLEGAELNEQYYRSKWREDYPSRRLIQYHEELNIQDRKLFAHLEPIIYRSWDDSILTPNLVDYYKIFANYLKLF